MLVVPAHVDPEGVPAGELLLAERAGVGDGRVFEVLRLYMAKDLVPARSSELTQGTCENLSFRVAHNVRNDLLFPCSNQVCNQIA